jgi:hypothetical protein
VNEQAKAYRPVDMAIGLATTEYLKWSEVPITFDWSDHPDFILKSGQYPLIVSTNKDVKLNWVLVNGGSSLNILFLQTFWWGHLLHEYNHILKEQF